MKKWNIKAPDCQLIPADSSEPEPEQEVFYSKYFVFT